MNDAPGAESIARPVARPAVQSATTVPRMPLEDDHMISNDTTVKLIVAGG